MKIRAFLFLIMSLLLSYFALGCSKSFKVTFNGNGGTLVSGTPVQTVKKGEKAIAPLFEKEGYILSWDIQFDNVTADLVVTAVWERQSFAVTFNANGGTLVSGNETQEVYYNEAAIPPVYEKEGHHLSFDKSYNNIKNHLIINAVWEKQSFTVTFNGHGGTLISGDETQEVYYNEAAIPPVYEKEGHHLTFDKPYNVIKNNTTINAVWNIKFYTVSFNLNGGLLLSGELVQSIQHGKNAVLPILEKEGYTYYFNKSVENITKDLVIDVIWEEITYTVTFNANGGILMAGDEVQNIKSGDSASAPVYRLEGYILTYDIPFDNITEDITVNAVWSTYLRVNQEKEIDPLGQYLLFGEFPQTIKEDGVAVSEVENDQGYYLGDDGYFYVKVRPKSHSMQNYFYSNGSIVTSLQDEFFKLEPILWRILEENNTVFFLYSEFSLLPKQFHNDTKNREFENKTIYPNNYEFSELRFWLNNTFYNSFFENERDLIVSSFLKNDVKSTGHTHNPYICNDTTDFFFIPSRQELINVDHGFHLDYTSLDPNRQKLTSDYARAKGSQFNTTEDTYGKGYAWIRSPSYFESFSSGSIYGNGHVGGRTTVTNTSTSVAPMVRIKK